MKNTYILIVTAFMLVNASAGYATSTVEEESMDSSSAMEMSEGMMGGMHGKGKMHHGMKGHHMMRSGVSPVTIMIQPGMMPMMGHGMMQQGAMNDHKGGGMRQEEMKQRQKMMKEHMERMEQRLANIEALISELVELQKQE
ncbi:MAG: hypothetical protein WBM41_01450 [Arenicellales bacterium]